MFTIALHRPKRTRLVHLLGQEGNKVGRLFLDFSVKNLPGFGGLIPFAEFQRRVGTEPAFQFLDLGYTPRVYPVERIVTSFLLGMVSGFDRVREVARLGRDLPLLRGLKNWNRPSWSATITASAICSLFSRKRRY